MSAPWNEPEPEVVADYAPNPVGRPEDVAAAAAFLASPLADCQAASIAQGQCAPTGE